MAQVMQSSLLTLTVLEHVSVHQPVRVAEVAEALGKPKSTVQRALDDPARGGLDPARRLGVDALGAHAPRARGRPRGRPTSTACTTPPTPALDQVRRESRESGILAVRDESDWVVVDFLEGLRPVQVRVEIGRRFPLHAGAAGKAILAFLPSAEIDELLGSASSARSPSARSRRPSLLREELARIRAARATPTRSARSRPASTASPRRSSTATARVIASMSLTIPESSPRGEPARPSSPPGWSRAAASVTSQLRPRQLPSRSARRRRDADSLIRLVSGRSDGPSRGEHSGIRRLHPELRPGVPARGRPRQAEHKVLMHDVAVVKAADKAGFKYVWVTEHHFLDEYSHLSANDVFCGLPRQRDRAHPHRVGHLQPAAAGEPPGEGRRAGRRCSTTSPTAASSSAPAAAPAATRSSASCPGIESTSITREIWEDVIGEFPKMWMQDTYEGYEGKFWSLPPRKILPKPYHKPHPPMWYAAGNTSSWEMCARRGPRRARLLGRRPRRARAGAQVVQGRRSRTPSRSARSSTTT